MNTDWQLCIWRTCGQLLIKADRIRTQCRGRAAALMLGCCVAPSSCGCHYWRNLCIKGQLWFSLFSVFAKAEPIFSLRMKVLFHVLFFTTEHRSWMIYFFLLISIFFFCLFLAPLCSHILLIWQHQLCWFFLPSFCSTKVKYNFCLTFQSVLCSYL